MQGYDVYSLTTRAAAIRPGVYKSAGDATAAPASNILDLRDVPFAVLRLVTGTITDAQTLVVTASDHADMSGGAVLTQTELLKGTLTDFLAIAAGDDNTQKELAFVPRQRYLRVTCTGAGGTGGVFGVELLGALRYQGHEYING